MDCELQKNVIFFPENFNYRKGENFMSNILGLPGLGEKWI